MKLISFCLDSSSVAVPTELRSLAVQTVDGQVLLYTPAVLSEPRLKEFASFPSPCPTFTVTSFNLPFVGPNTDASASSSSSSSDHHLSDALAGLRLSSSSSSSSSDCVALGLDTRSKLWAGDRLLAPQCSSLALHPSFVLVTTVGHPQHTLYVLDRHRPLDAFTDRDLGQLAQYGACFINSPILDGVFMLDHPVSWFIFTQTPTRAERWSEVLAWWPSCRAPSAWFFSCLVATCAYP